MRERKGEVPLLYKGLLYSSPHFAQMSTPATVVGAHQGPVLGEWPGRRHLTWVQIKIFSLSILSVWLLVNQQPASHTASLKHSEKEQGLARHVKQKQLFPISLALLCLVEFVWGATVFNFSLKGQGHLNSFNIFSNGLLKKHSSDCYLSRVAAYRAIYYT